MRDRYRRLRHGWRIGILVALCLTGATCRSPSSQEEPQRLVFKHPRLLSREEPLRVLLDEFRQSHPDIRLHEEVLPSSSDQQHLFYVTNLEAQASDFDVLALDIIWIPEFRRAGWLRDVTHHLSTADRDDFLPASLEAGEFQRQIYAVPWFADAGVLYYRKDLLDRYGFAPPRTVTDLISISHSILRQEQNPALSGFVWQGKQYEGLLCVALEFIRAYGGDLLDTRGQSLLTTPMTVVGLRALRDTISVSAISPPLVTTADEETARHVFARGEAIFMRNWPYAWTLLNAPDSPLRGRVGVTSVPGSATHPGVPTLGGWHLGINRFSRRPDIAGELIAFLTSTEAQRRLALAGGLKPTRLSAYDTEQLHEEDPTLSLFLPFLRTARPRPVTPFYLMLAHVLQGEVSAAVAGMKPVEVALRDAEQQVEQILALDIQGDRHGQTN